MVMEKRVRVKNKMGLRHRCQQDQNVVFEYFDDNTENWPAFCPKDYSDFIEFCKIDGDEECEEFKIVKLYRQYFLLGFTTDDWIDKKELETTTDNYDSDADGNTQTKPLYYKMTGRVLGGDNKPDGLATNKSSEAYQVGVKDNGDGEKGQG